MIDAATVGDLLDLRPALTRRPRIRKALIKYGHRLEARSAGSHQTGKEIYPRSMTQSKMERRHSPRNGRGDGIGVNGGEYGIRSNAGAGWGQAQEKGEWKRGWDLGRGGGVVASWFGLVVSRFKVWCCGGPLDSCWPWLRFIASGWFCLGFLVWV